MGADEDDLGDIAGARRPGIDVPVGAVCLRLAGEGQPEGLMQAGLAVTGRRERRGEKEGIVGRSDSEPLLELGGGGGETVCRPPPRWGRPRYWSPGRGGHPG